MKVLDSQFKPLGKQADWLINGHLNYKGTLQLLIDERPEIIFKKIGSFLYGEKDGFVKVYYHDPRSKDGFGGAYISIKFEDGTETIYKGSLWDPGAYEVQYCCGGQQLPEYRAMSWTTDPKVMERGHTFCGGYVTKELYDKLLADDIKIVGDNEN